MIPSASLIVAYLFEPFRGAAASPRARAQSPIQLGLLLLALDRVERRARRLRRRVDLGLAPRKVQPPERAVRLQMHEEHVRGLLRLVRREDDVARRVRLEDPQ